MYKGIIFDLDGTLLDTSEDILTVLNQSLEKFSLNKISSEQICRYLGNGAKKLVERAVAQDNSELTEKVYKDYSKNFAVCENNLTKLYEGEDEVLKNLQNCGIRMAILSNKPQYGVDSVYKKLLSKYGFDIVKGNTTKEKLKPDPSSTLEIIAKFGLLKEECLFVGDGDTDVETANNARIDCLSVLWGYRTEEDLKKSGAKYFAKDWKDLENFVFR